MKSLNGYLKKILSLISLCFFLSSFQIHKAQAQESDFNISTSFIHEIQNDRVDTKLTIHIRSDITKVISFYTASINTKDISPKCMLIDGEDLHCTKYNRTSITDVQFDLKNRVVKPDFPLEIVLTYSTPLNSKTALGLPSSMLDAKTDDVTIIYPENMGKYRWASDSISSQKLVDGKYELLINNPSYKQISIFFTEKIQYKFSINRVFTNTTGSEPQTFELIVPSDTEIQSILWEQIEPLPNSTVMDEDGNYILKYIVKEGESIDCKISGYIQKENPEKEDDYIPPYLLKSSGYWEISDFSEIKRIHAFLKEKGVNTNGTITDIEILKKEQKQELYKYLYQYVIHRLETTKNVKLGIDNTIRSGTTSLIKNSSNANPIDYADFYMALLRYFSIPSRMVLGYVSNVTSYTTDGFYHYWIEYYDSTTNKWVSADPFMEEHLEHPLLGSPLNDHIVILKRGKSSVSPTLTFYSPLDFTISLANETHVEKVLELKAELSFEKYDITERQARAYMLTSNTGNVTISKISLRKSNLGNIRSYIDSVNNENSLILLPRQNSSIQLNIPHEKIKEPYVYITASYGNSSTTEKEIMVESVISDGIPIYTKILSKILSIISFVIAILLIYAGIKLIKRAKWKQQ